jgi:hypothetical protein
VRALRDSAPSYTIIGYKALNDQMRTALTAPLVLYRTRMANAMKKFWIIGQWQNKLFLIVISCFSLVKAAMNALRVCKLRKNCLTGIDQCYQKV